MQYIRRDFVYIFLATSLSCLVCLFLFWYLLKNTAETEKKWQKCDEDLGACNFEISKATEKYVQVLEMYYSTSEALHITENKLLNREAQLMRLSKKYPTENIYTVQ